MVNYGSVPFMGQYSNPYAGQSSNLFGAQQYNAQVTRVNGENGARAFQMAPNSSALLLDETSPIVWLAQTDGAGYKTVTPYKIEPYQVEQPVNMNDFEERLKKLEEQIYGKSNTSSTSKRTKQSNGESDGD